MKKHRLTKALLAISIVSLLICTALLIDEKRQLDIGEAQRSLRPEEFSQSDDGADNSAEPDEPDNAAILAKLKEKNPDIVGWLTVDGTKIDYPLVQGEDNAYYTTHTAELESSKSGAIFLDRRANGDFTGFNSVLYGHNMKNGSMFADLVKFKDAAYFNSHQTGTLYLMNGTYPLAIIACAVTTSTSGYYDYTPASPAEREAHMAMVLETAKFCSYIEQDSPPQRILTLSTCSYEGTDTRTVVIAEIGEAF